MSWLIDNCEIVRAEDVREGDRVCFEVPQHSYIVETVENWPMDLIRFRYHDDTGSQTFWPGDCLFIQRAGAGVSYAQS